MTAPRRRLLRTIHSPPAPPQSTPHLQRLRARLVKERAALARWLSRLKRAFHALEKTQARVSRIEKQIARTEEG